MRPSVRRRLVVGGGVLSAALVAGLLVTAAPASAAVTALTTPVNDRQQVVTFTTDGPVDPGSTVTFDGPVEGTDDQFTGRVDNNDASRQRPSVTVNFATAAGGGPANPGRYRVTFMPSVVPASAPPGVCDLCLTVVTPTEPTAASASPSGLPRNGAPQNVTLTGTGFARDTTVVVLNADGSVPSEARPAEVTVSTPTGTARDGAETPTSLRRQFTVATNAPLGGRVLRLTNTDGRTSDCTGCFTVLGAPFTSVTPISSTNTPSDDAVELTFTGPAGTFGTDAQVTLAYDRSGADAATRARLSVPGSVTSRAMTGAANDGSFLRALFDLRAAAPGEDVYLPTVVSSSGGTSTSPTRFDVRQPDPVTVSGVAPRNQAAGTTAQLTVSGTGFAKGAAVAFERAANPPTTAASTIQATQVEFQTPTTLRVTLTLPAEEGMGPRSVRVTNTDGANGVCAGTATPPCFTVDMAASPTPSASASPSPSASASASVTPSPSRSATPTATASASPSAPPAPTSASPSAAPVRPTLSLERSTITSQEAAVVNGTASPGSVVQLMAYSRPSTAYRVAREAVVGGTGAVRFEVRPSGNTRMFLRRFDAGGGNQVDSGSIVLSVRTSINLKVARTEERTYRFTGSTLPKRRGQLVTVFYQPDGGNRVIASRARVAQDGTYNVTRTFTGTGTFTLFTATGTDINNVGNESNRVRTTIR